MFTSRIQRREWLQAISCTVSVVKADHVQGGATTKGDEYFCGYQQPFLVNRFVTFLLDCMFGKMILLRLKSDIPAGFCKLNRRWTKKALYSWLVQSSTYTDKEVQEAFLTENIRIFRTCTISVYQAAPQGAGAWGRGYLRSSSLLHATIHKHLIGWKLSQKKLWEKFVRVD